MLGLFISYQNNGERDVACCSSNSVSTQPIDQMAALQMGWPNTRKSISALQRQGNCCSADN